MTEQGYLLLGLTAIVAALSGILAFAAAKFVTAARAVAKDARKGGSETAFMAAAMEDAIVKLRTKERAMKQRAEASERLSGEIIVSMTSGLLVVGEDGVVRTLNPAGRRLLGLPDADWTANYREVLGESGSVHRAAWPTADPAALVLDEIELPVQVNGKVRDRVTVPADAPESEIVAAALALPNVVAHTEGKTVRKVVVVPGKLVSVVVG